MGFAFSVMFLEPFHAFDRLILILPTMIFFLHPANTPSEIIVKVVISSSMTFLFIHSLYMNKVSSEKWDAEQRRVCYVCHSSLMKIIGFS